MKHIVKILAIASMIFLTAGCDRPSESESSSVISENDSTVSMPSTDSSAISTTNSVSDGASEKNNVPIDYEPFNGLPKSENAINTVNCKDFRPSLLCYGDGSTFFMWNGTVYRHNGETTEALFEKNAYDLNYYDGMLYFIENDRYDLNSLDQIHIEGILYCCDLNKGVIEALTDYPVVLPFVNNGEILYTDYATADDPEPTGIYRINNDGISERLYSGMKFIGYGDHRLKFDWTDEEKVYFSQDDKALLLENIHPHWDCIVGDYYYYYRSLNDNSLNRLSVLTGEIETLPNNTESGFTCLDYTVLNDDIYLIDDKSGLLKYNFETGDYTGINCDNAFRYIYADDKNIYAVGFEREEESINHTFHFIKLTINGGSAKCEVLA